VAVGADAAFFNAGLVDFDAVFGLVALVAAEEDALDFRMF
jgi:hypothetical protein